MLGFSPSLGWWKYHTGGMQLHVHQVNHLFREKVCLWKTAYIVPLKDILPLAKVYMYR